MPALPVPPHLADFWAAFCAVRGGDAADRFYEAFHFDDNEPSANALGRLVLDGVKRATAGLLWSYEHDGMPLPVPGNLSIVTDFAKRPLCVIETTRVDIVPYAEVSDEFAATEGEGDGSLAFWKRAHWAYFGRECERIGRERTESMPVVCERFSVVFRPEG